MTTEHDVDLLLDRWLAEGATELPDRILDAALDIVQRTHQRPVLRLPWRTRAMFVSTRLAAAATLVVLLAVGGAYIVGSDSTKVVPTSSSPSAQPSVAPTVGAAATPSTAPTARPTLIPGTSALSGKMTAGTTYTVVVGTVFTIKGQAGWYSLGGDVADVWLAKGPNEPNPPDTYTFGITWAGQVIPPLGASAPATAAPSDLVAWLEANPDLSLGAPTPVTIGGLSGTALKGTVRLSATANAGVNLVCAANQYQCAQEQPNALGFAPTGAFELVVLPVNGKPLVIGMQGPSADWATNAKVLDPMLQGITFP